MKDMVLVPIKFILFLLAVMAIGTGLQILVDFSRLSPDLQRQGMHTISLLVVNSFFFWILPGIGLTWLFSSFSILRNGRMKRTRQIFLMLLVAVSLFAVLYFFPPLDHARSESRQLDFQVPQKTILSNDEAFFVLQGEGKDGRLLLHSTKPDARFMEATGVIKNLDTQELLLPDQGMTIMMNSVTGGRQVLFEDPAFMNPFRLLLLDGLRVYQNNGMNDLLHAAVLAGCTALLLASMWLFVRLTLWPLVNSVISFLLLCGLGILPGVFGWEAIRDLVALVPPYLQTWLLPGCFGLLSLVFFGCTLFLPSRKDWPAGVNL